MHAYTATDPRPLSEWTPEALIQRFENDIKYDAHATMTKFSRSDARKELQRRGRHVLAQIAAHLRERLRLHRQGHVCSHRVELDSAWYLLLIGMASRPVLGLSVDALPDSSGEVTEVIMWCEANAPC